jgi:hypothetical protein
MLSAIVLAAMLTLWILGNIFRSKREKIREKFANFKKKMVWSGLIKSLSLSYLNICIAISASF